MNANPAMDLALNALVLRQLARLVERIYRLEMDIAVIILAKHAQELLRINARLVRLDISRRMVSAVHAQVLA